MKIRNGFVSNSSSSSFIVGFTKVPKTQDDLHEIMFPNNIKEDMIGDGYTGELSIEAVVARVWSDIQRTEPAKASLINKELESYVYDYNEDGTDHSKSDAIDKKYKEKYGTKDNYWDHEDWKKEYESVRQKEWRDQEKRMENKARQFKKENWKKLGLEGKKIYIFDYSDNDGEAVLEHCDIFESLPHIRVSHH